VIHLKPEEVEQNKKLLHEEIFQVLSEKEKYNRSLVKQVKIHKNIKSKPFISSEIINFLNWTDSIKFTIVEESAAFIMMYSFISTLEPEQLKTINYEKYLRLMSNLFLKMHYDNYDGIRKYYPQLTSYCGDENFKKESFQIETEILNKIELYPKINTHLLCRLYEKCPYAYDFAVSICRLLFSSCIFYTSDQKELINAIILLTLYFFDPTNFMIKNIPEDLKKEFLKSSGGLTFEYYNKKLSLILKRHYTEYEGDFKAFKLKILLFLTKNSEMIETLSKTKVFSSNMAISPKLTFALINGYYRFQEEEKKKEFVQETK